MTKFIESISRVFFSSREAIALIWSYLREEKQHLEIHFADGLTQKHPLQPKRVLQLARSQRPKPFDNFLALLDAANSEHINLLSMSHTLVSVSHYLWMLYRHYICYPYIELRKKQCQNELRANKTL